MIAAIALLLAYQLAGEILSRLFNLPVPGPVIGMFLLFLALNIGEGPGDDLRGATEGLLQHMSLLFIPAGTGLMLHFGLLQAEWPALLAALVVSTVAGMAVTALVMKACRRNDEGKHGGAA